MTGRSNLVPQGATAEHDECQFPKALARGGYLLGIYRTVEISRHAESERIRPPGLGARSAVKGYARNAGPCHLLLRYALEVAESLRREEDRSDAEISR